MDTEHRYLQLRVTAESTSPATMKIHYDKEPKMETEHDNPMESLLEVANQAGKVLLRLFILGVLCLALAAILAGCASAMGDRSAIRDQVVQRITGTTADAFFIANGPARSEYRAANGTVVYDWTTHLPGTLPLSRPLCTISLTVDQGGTIIAVRIMNDAVGFRRASACDEVLR